MREETKKRVNAMSQEEMERRFAELSIKCGVADPRPLRPEIQPSEISLEEAEEREYLKIKLGYTNSSEES